MEKILSISNKWYQRVDIFEPKLSVLQNMSPFSPLQFQHQTIKNFLVVVLFVDFWNFLTVDWTGKQLYLDWVFFFEY